MSTPRHAPAARLLPGGRTSSRLASITGHRLFFASVVVALLLIGAVLIAWSLRSAVEQGQGAPPAVAPPASTTSPSPSRPTRSQPALVVPSAASTTGSSAKPNEDATKTSKIIVAPTKITIPAIGVDTSIIRLGMAANHTAQVPPYDKAGDVGWYTPSPAPGTVGPAVLIGHIDSPYGPAVFYRMAQLKRGDKITIDRADGSIATFTVDRLQTYAKSSFPTRAVYGDTDTAQLRLITCGGAYLRNDGGYQANTVAFAHLDSIRAARR